MGIALTDLQATTQNELDNILHDTVYDKIAMLQWFKKHKRVKCDGGDFEWDVVYKEYGLAEAIDMNQKITYETVEMIDQATDKWKAYAVTAFVTLEERIKNYGKGQIIDLQKAKAEYMAKALYQKLSTDLYTANPNGKGLTPISTIIDSAAVYAGLDPATYTTWVGIEDNSTDTMELDGAATSLMGMYMQAWFGDDAPDVFFTTKNLLMKYGSIINNKTRYEYGGRDAKEAGMGRTNLFFMGCPIFPDPACPAASFYGIQTDSMELKVHPEADMKAQPWMPAEGQSQPFAFKRETLAILNLRCIQRRTNFKMTALDYTK